MKHPLITAIVSTYAAERFIAGCMHDLIAQTIFEEIEVLVIDSGSPEGESRICAEFARQHPQIKLVRTEREPLYVAWNRALQLASGKYITSANTDDRHSPRFMETLAERLEASSNVALVYADQFISLTANETFAECQQRDARLRRWPDYSPTDLILRCITGSQPMWLKSLHAQFGVFDANYKNAAHYDMWLRFASDFEFFRIPETLGVLYDSPDTISGSNNRNPLSLEILEIKQKYM